MPRHLEAVGVVASHPQPAGNIITVHEMGDEVATVLGAVIVEQMEAHIVGLPPTPVRQTKREVGRDDDHTRRRTDGHTNNAILRHEISP